MKKRGIIIFILILFFISYVEAKEVLTFKNLFDNFKEAFMGKITSYDVVNDTNIDLSTLPNIHIFYPNQDNTTVKDQNITVVTTINNADVIYDKLNDGEERIELLSDNHWIKRFSLKLGSNLINIRACKNDNCSSTSIGINYDPNKDVKIEYGSIYISTTPVKADLYIDNSPYGLTPQLIQNIQLGLHSLNLTQTNYTSYYEVFNLSINQTLNFKIVLNKIGIISYSTEEIKKIVIPENIKKLREFTIIMIFKKIFKIQ